MESHYNWNRKQKFSLMFLSFRNSLVLRYGLRGLPYPLFNVVVVVISLGEFCTRCILLEKFCALLKFGVFVIEEDCYLNHVAGVNPMTAGKYTANKLATGSTSHSASSSVTQHTELFAETETE